jgi:hypothetical protein
MHISLENSISSFKKTLEQSKQFRLVDILLSVTPVDQFSIEPVD